MLFRGRRARRALLATVGIVAALAIAGATPAAAAKKNKASVTLSGSVSGKNTGGTLVCIESTQLKGPQLSLTLGSFMVGGQRYTLSAALAGSNYAAGTFDLSEPTGIGVFLQLAGDTGGARWYSSAKSGTITLAKNSSRGSRRPASNVGPWPARTGCTTNSYSSINPRSAKASGRVTPPTNTPSPGSSLSC